MNVIPAENVIHYFEMRQHLLIETYLTDRDPEKQRITILPLGSLHTLAKSPIVCESGMII